MKEITNEEAHFVLEALNKIFLEAHEKLQRNNLREVERENYERTKYRAKKLMEKLDSEN